MTTVPSRVRALAVTSLIGVWTVLTYACTGGVENPAYVYVPDSGNTTGFNNVQVGADICGKYGGYDQVKLLADAIITTAKADCHLTPIIDDTDQHLHDCFQIFVGNSFLCPGVTFAENTSVDSQGVACESFIPGVKLSPIDWQDFAAFGADSRNYSAAESVFRAYHLTADELSGVGNFFAQKQESVLNSDVRSDKNSKCSIGCGGDVCNPDAGTPPVVIPPVKDSGTPVKDTGIADAPTDG